MPDREYKRLTWTRRHSNPSFLLTLSSSLWLGKDHLLLIESNGYTEKYKRFYFKDIQALIICRTRVGLIRVIVLGVLAGFFALLALGMRDEPGALWTMAVFAFLFAIAAISDALFGPTALCYLRTAVQLEQLPSLKRIRRAREVLEVLKPLIATSQGTLTPEEVSLRVESRSAAPINSTVSAPQAAAGEAPPKIVP